MFIICLIFHFRFLFRYNVLFMLITYVLPISAMSFAYLRMGLKLWRSTWIGECCDKQLGNMKSKRRVSTVILHSAPSMIDKRLDSIVSV